MPPNSSPSSESAILVLPSVASYENYAETKHPLSLTYQPHWRVKVVTAEELHHIPDSKQTNENPR